MIMGYQIKKTLFGILLFSLLTITSCMPSQPKEVIQKRIVVYKCDGKGESVTYTLILARNAFTNISETTKICQQKFKQIRNCEQFKKYSQKCLNVIKQQSELFIHEIDSTLMDKTKKVNQIRNNNTNSP